MTTNDIITKLRDIAEPYVLKKELLQTYNERTDFLKDLEINSANLVDIVLDVEDAFDIEINDEQMEQMLTVGDAVRIIEQNISSK